MKRRLAIALILMLVLPSMACKLFTRTSPSTPPPPSIQVETQDLQVPTSPVEEPTQTSAVESTPEEQTPTAAEVTDTPEAPVETQEPTFLPLVPTATTGESAAAGVIDSVTLARDTQGDQKQPANPTTTFTSSSVIHAVVHVKNAPANTKISATWSVVDAGSAAAPNTEIDTTEITTDGTRYVDFTLSPKDKWPVGKYKVAISLNGQPYNTYDFSVQ
jgi:hypothetical protein